MALGEPSVWSQRYLAGDPEKRVPAAPRAAGLDEGGVIGDGRRRLRQDDAEVFQALFGLAHGGLLSSGILAERPPHFKTLPFGAADDRDDVGNVEALARVVHQSE